MIIEKSFILGGLFEVTMRSSRMVVFVLQHEEAAPKGLLARCLRFVNIPTHTSRNPIPGQITDVVSSVSRFLPAVDASRRKSKR